MNSKALSQGSVVLALFLVAGCTSTSDEKPVVAAPPAAPAAQIAPAAPAAVAATPTSAAADAAMLERAIREIEGHRRTFAHTPLPIRSATISGPTRGRFLLRGTESTDYCVQVVVENSLLARGVNALISIEQSGGPSRQLQVNIGSVVCPGGNPQPLPRLIELRKERIARSEAACAERLRTTASSSASIRPC